MKITIQIYQNGEEIRSKVFDTGVYRIGRSDFSDIVLKNDAVSRSHIEIRVTDVAVYMTNMSTNGRVKVNGELLETAEILDGDEINIGPYQILIFHGERNIEPPKSEALAEASPSEEAAPAPNESPPSAESPDNVFQFENKRDSPPDEPNAPAVSLQTDGSSALRAETLVELKPVVAKIVFEEGARKGDELFLEAFEITLGRSKKADIAIDDEKLSRLHAKITRVGMGYRLVDLNSRNGTYVNGMRVLEHPLSSFDVIELGHCKIRFLIHDLIAGNMAGGALIEHKGGKNVSGSEQTRSLPSEEPHLSLADPIPHDGITPLSPSLEAPGPESRSERVLRALHLDRLNRRSKIILSVCLILLAVVLILPSRTPEKSKEGDKTTEVANGVANVNTKIPPAISKEYQDLSPEEQRAIEGYYNTALRAADRENYEEAIASLKKLHEKIPYYKQSQELLQQYSRELKAKQIASAQDRAKKDMQETLQDNLNDGITYLKEGDFEKAADAFNQAIGIDPNNDTAIKGLKAAELRLRSIDLLPPPRDIEKEKKLQVAELFEKAKVLLEQRSYQQAVEVAERIRQIEIKGDTQYLNVAKQVIDRAKSLQKEEVEPFIIQAKEKFQEGDYNAARDLSEEMLKRFPGYQDVTDLLNKSKKKLDSLAKEAYTHGYILESMNRLEEAKQYWNRAKNYVRPGDPYYDKVIKKLDYYQ